MKNIKIHNEWYRLLCILLFFTILFCFFSSRLSAQSIGEPFYIYRNDGQINGFFRGEIDSIAFSFYDRDSLLHNDIVTQVVFTEDSVYRIPLEVIDSVGFVTPKTKCKSGVIDLSVNHMPYIISCDSLTVNFSESTPSELFPMVGDKLMTLEMNEIFPAGFAGEVTAVSGDKVICKRVPLEDIFETYYNVTSAYGYIEDSDGKVKKRFPIPIDKTWAKDFKFNTITIPFTAELSRNVKPNSDLALKGGSDYSVEITPSFHVRATLIINNEEGTYFSASVTGEVNIKNKVSIFGGIDWSHDFVNKDLSIEKPISQFVNFVFSPGIFLRSNATASLSAVLEQTYSFCWGRDWSSKGRNVLNPTNNCRLKSYDFDIEGCVDGSIGAGLYTEMGVSLLHSDLDKFVFRGELGGEFVSHAMLYNFDIDDACKNTKTYERFKQSSFDLNVFANSSLHAKLADGLWDAGFPLPPYILSYQLKTWDVVPTFSNTTFMQSFSPKTSADALVDISGNCLIPKSVGLSVRDENGEEVGEHYDDNKFDNGVKNLKFTFSNLSPDREYTLYPKVRICGWDILASPAAKLEKNDCPVSLSDFRVAKSQYKKDGFEHYGQNYDYRFDVSLTATLDVDDLSQVEDWGYVYRDPNGSEEFISLGQFGAEFTDTRYAYYRNQPHATCTLYGYIKYVGSDETVLGISHDYELKLIDSSCPDENHPHWIDLGLPSGTQWCCCNVGASSPEVYGEYVTFGQVDSAPTQNQIKELINYCTTVWASRNEVNGRIFIGPNGRTFFLPAAGGNWENRFWYVGSGGYYLSSSHLDYTIFLYINSDDAYCGDDRFIKSGYKWPVRPVRSE